MRTIKKTLIYMLSIMNRMKKHQIGAFSAQMAYFFTLSVFPMLIFIFSILSTLNLNYEYVDSLLSEILPSNISYLIVGFMEQTIGVQGGAVLSFSGIMILYASSRGVNAFQSAVNHVYGHENKRNFFLMKLYSMFYTLMFILLIVVSLLIPNIGVRFIDFIEKILSIEFDFSWINTIFVVRNILLPIVYVVVIGSAYLFLPSDKLTIKSAYKGALFAIICSYGANLIFSNIVIKVTDYSILYGSLSAMIAFMVWLYTQCTILLIGAEINAFEYKKKDD